jgi:predicted neuraminidase
MPVCEHLYDRPFAHCATLMEIGDGELMTSWMGGYYETASNVALLASNLKLGSDVWSEPRVIADVPDHSLGQPVLLPRSNGELWLFFVVIMQTDWTSAVPYVQNSYDGGQMWETPVQLFDYPGLMFRSRALITGDRIIVPAYDENTWQSRMMISDDDGKTWRLSTPLVSPNGNIHPCLVERSDGSLLCYLRTGGKGGVIWRTTSDDDGETWAELTPTELPNPNSGIDLLRLDNDKLVLAFNNSATLRTPLCLALADEDEQWDCIQPIETDYGEFSYPTLAQRPDGTLHLVYTYKREHIHYVQFTEDWLRGGC